MYTFDGVNYVATGITVDENSGTPTIEQDGDLIKISVGEQSFTLEKPEEIVFEIRAGKVNFASEETVNINVVTTGIEDLSVLSCPKGWYASVNSNGQIEITAPDIMDTRTTYDDNDNPIPPTAVANGYVKIHACSNDGKCMVGRLAVSVGNNPLIVKAYGNNIFISGQGFYGISTPETIEDDVTPLCEALQFITNASYDTPEEDFNAAYEVMFSYPMCEWEVSTSLTEMLGDDMVIGQDYIVWAMEFSMMGGVGPGQTKPDYSINSLVKTYVTPYLIEVEEDQTKKAPYNVEVSVSTTGIDSYIAYAIPSANLVEPGADEDYMKGEIEYYKSQIIYAYQQGEVCGKLMTEGYSGSLLEICEGTDAYSAGGYAPNSPVALLILPIDGRDLSDYSTEDIQEYVFYTDALSDGGSVSPVLSLYTGENPNPYSKMYANISIEGENWTYLYYSWLTSDDYTALGGENATDADLLEVLLLNYGMTPGDVTSLPFNEEEDCEAGETKYLVAMVVDAEGKYGNIEILEVSAPAISYNENLVLNLNLEKSNLTLDNEEYLLKNVKELQISFDTNDATVSKYKYITCQPNQYWHPYENATAKEMATLIVTSNTSIEAVVTDGVITIGEHNYNTNYYLAVLAYDADGNPAKEAFIIEYKCVFVIENIISDESQFVAEPIVEVTLPTTVATESENEKYYCYFNADSDYPEWSTYNYGISYTVTPEENTTVRSVLVNVSSQGYPELPSATISEKVSKIWTNGYTLSSYGMVQTTAEPQTKLRGIWHYADVDAPGFVLCVSWQDAEGNYYYKELPVDIASLKTMIDESIAASTPSVDPL